MLRDIAAAFQPHAWVNVHSGMEALFLPYDHVARVPEGPDAAASLALLQHLNVTSCGGRCAVGSGGKSVGCVLRAPQVSVAPGRDTCGTLSEKFMQA